MRTTQRRWIDCYCVMWPMMWTMLVPLSLATEERTIDAAPTLAQRAGDSGKSFLFPTDKIQRPQR